jgi:hypothetical protein
MARRKRRRTKRSRSQSTAARRRLTLGDIVGQDEVDPDYDDTDWRLERAIIAFETWGRRRWHSLNGTRPPA